MKTKTTRKYIKQNYKNIIMIPNYLNIQNLIRYKSPDYYLTRSEGWAADVYHIDFDTCIVEGYAPIGNIKPDTKTAKQYNDKAKKIDNHKTYKWKTKEEKINDLLYDFCVEVSKQ